MPLLEGLATREYHASVVQFVDSRLKTLPPLGMATPALTIVRSEEMMEAEAR